MMTRLLSSRIGARRAISSLSAATRPCMHIRTMTKVRAVAEVEAKEEADATEGEKTARK